MHYTENLKSFYDEINELYDAFAERLLMVGGKPISNLKGYLEIAIIKEASGL
jgi:starvation-inducible DNA-binding protein